MRLHLHMHFYIRNADTDVGKLPTYWHVIQTRMKSDAKSLKPHARRVIYNNNKINLQPTTFL
jgi:hypothetical protein